MVAKLFRKRINSILAKFNEEDIISESRSANFFGLESKGVKQVRGNGVLVVTREKVYFEMWVKPRSIIEIPIKSIIKVESVKSHIHKTKFGSLLKIAFTNEQGESDSVAWWVKNLEDWLDNIEKLIPFER